MAQLRTSYIRHRASSAGRDQLPASSPQAPTQATRTQGLRVYRAPPPFLNMPQIDAKPFFLSNFRSHQNQSQNPFRHRKWAKSDLDKHRKLEKMRSRKGSEKSAPKWLTNWAPGPFKSMILHRRCYAHHRNKCLKSTPKIDQKSLKYHSGNGTKKKDNPKLFFLDFPEKMSQNGSRKEGGESPIF